MTSSPNSISSSIIQSSDLPVIGSSNDSPLSKKLVANPLQPRSSDSDELRLIKARKTTDTSTPILKKIPSTPSVSSPIHETSPLAIEEQMREGGGSSSSSWYSGSYASRFVNGAWNLGTATVSKTIEIGSNLVNKTISIIQVPIVNPLHTYFGYNINLFNHAYNLVTTQTNFFSSNSLNHKTLLKRLGDMRPLLDDHIAKVRDLRDPNLRATNPTQSNTPPEVSEPVNLSVEELAQIESMRVIEERVRQRLIDRTVAFTTFRFVNESILGRKPDDVFSYYTDIINSSSPKEIYYGELSFIQQLIARILIPLIEWIMGLIFYYKEGNASGISNVIEMAKTYFADPINRNTEFETFLESFRDYLFKLNKILDEFNGGEGGTLTYPEYLKKRLKEDLIERNTPKEELYNHFYSWLVDLMNIESGIPIIGPCVDKIITASLKPILENLNLVEALVSQGLGAMRPNSGFTYAVMSFLTTQLTEWTKQVRANAYETEDKKISLNDRQKDIIHALFTNLKNYIPNEGRSTEEMQNDLQNQPYWITRKIREKAEPMVWSAMENAFQKLIHSVFIELGNPVMRQTLWNECLRLLNSIFEPAPARSEEECDQIYREAHMRMHEFIGATLEVFFKDEYSKSQQELEDSSVTKLTSQTRLDIDHCISTLANVNTTWTQIFSDNTNHFEISELERTLLTATMEIKALFSKLFNTVDSCYDGVSGKVRIEMATNTQTSFLVGISNVSARIKVIGENIDQITTKVETLRNFQTMFLQTENLLRVDEETISENAADILPGRSLDRMLDWVVSNCVTANITDKKRRIVPWLIHVKEMTNYINRKMNQAQDRQSYIQTLGLIAPLASQIESKCEFLSSIPSIDDINYCKVCIQSIGSSIINLKNYIPDMNLQVFRSSVRTLRTNLHNIMQRPAIASFLLDSRGNDLRIYLEQLITHTNALENLSRDYSNSPSSSHELERLQRQKTQLINSFLIYYKKIEPQLESIKQTHLKTTREILSTATEIQNTAVRLQDLLGRLSPPQSSEVAMDDTLLNNASLLLQLITPPSANLRMIHEVLNLLITDATSKTNLQSEIYQEELEAILGYKQKLRSRLEVIKNNFAGFIHEIMLSLSNVNRVISEQISEMQNAKMTIIDQRRVGIYPAPGFVKSFEKDWLVSQIINERFSKLLPFIINPQHFQEMLLRGVLARIREVAQ